MVAVLLVVLIGFLGLSIDVAHIRKSVQELQRSADAAALAAAQLVYEDDPDTDFAATRNEAINVAAANLVSGGTVVLDPNWGNAEGGDIVVGKWDRFEQLFTPTTVEPNAVQVRARRTSDSGGGDLALYFGPVFGTATSDIARTAIAHWGGDWGAAVIVLDPTMQGSLDIRGTADLTVPNDGIQVDSSDSQAFKMNGAPDVPRVKARRVDVVGNFRIPSGSCYPVPNAAADYVPDPLAGLPYPDKSTMLNRGSIRGAGNYLPGWYPGGIDFNSGTARLGPGIYYLGSPGINLNGSALLQGDGVMLFLDNGSVEMRISGTSPGIDVSGPTSGSYEGVVVFQHRLNGSACDISGGGLFDVRGTMYLAKGSISMDGNVDREVGRIVVNSLQLRGTAKYTITGIGHPPGGPKSSFLVQ
jgi:hypothetical protein